jgi:carboxyl-terminal processing protease
VLDGREHGGIIAAVGRHVPEARAVYARVFTAANRLTTARYYTPSGRSIQGLGIKPDVPVAETSKEEPQFGPEREADLNHVLENEGGIPDTGPEQRTDLPPITMEIPSKPPKGFLEFDPSKPDNTDFQLQQALVVARAMSTKQNHVTANGG